ncbi:hypothetical protein, partial [Bacillus solimangrovi]|uniref:hypothetical protein n=1 Tax=Bacillus solimangrovi TaxID=1305675 RepID=UPI001585EF34
NLNIGETVILTASPYPSDAFLIGVEWEKSNNNIDIAVNEKKIGEVSVTSKNKGYTVLEVISSENKDIKSSSLISVNSDNETPILKGNAKIVNPALASNLYTTVDKQGTEDLKNVFSVNYDLSLVGGRGSGDLTNIVIVQPLPEGVAWSSDSTSAIKEKEENGQRYIEIPFQNLEYSKVGLDSEQRETSEKMNLIISNPDLNSYREFDNVYLIDNGEEKKERWTLEIVTNHGFDKMNDLKLTFEDGTMEYLSLIENAHFKKSYPVQPVKLTQMRANDNPDIEQPTIIPHVLQQEVNFKVNWAVKDVKLPEAKVIYRDSNNSAQEQEETVTPPDDKINMTVILESNRTDNLKYIGDYEGRISLKYNDTDVIEVYAKSQKGDLIKGINIKSMNYSTDDSKVIEVTYKDGSKGYLNPFSFDADSYEVIGIHPKNLKDHLINEITSDL